MSILDPISHALAAVLAAAHSALTSLGADASTAVTWLLCLGAVVVLVRIALLPLAAHGVRVAHASARARPQLEQLTERFRDRKDPASRRAFLEERRRIAAEHRVPRFSVLPMLLQLPIWLALYHLISNVAGGHPVGAMGAGLVASLGGATLLGIRLTARGYFGAGPTHLLVVAGLAGLAAALSFATQKYFVTPNLIMTGQPATMVQLQQLMPLLSAAGLLIAAGVAPVALLIYWVINSAWTLGQSAVIWRWFPTPGSPAAARRSTGARATS
ncbi:membrane protein insertase YidC [Microlunatus elymi]|uniref:Membrane protein insertase YidC n=1 Tax=Microlunatus elymi TaxID=2596828 RepID=A0A516Q083_9ACTN|nr:membrane protein insertase YidC [Microlunatus elymi]QDP96830.1 membrane protein insertase YidC [Microlunatus elymi]